MPGLKRTPAVKAFLRALRPLKPSGTPYSICTGKSPTLVQPELRYGAACLGASRCRTKGEPRFASSCRARWR
jgi:hypothetical protein